MTSISSKSFSIELADGSSYSPRAIRRIICNAEVLKAAKLRAGDPVAVAGGNKFSIERAFAMGIVWPSLDLSPDTILVSSSHLLTARLQLGSQVRLYPLDGPPSSALDFPSIQPAQEAGTIRVRETSTNSSGIPSSAGYFPIKQQREWLTLLLREQLVDLRYITSRQVLEVRYEGQLRLFCVHSVSPQQTTSDDILADFSHDMSALSMDDSLQAWLVSWDTRIFVLGTRDNVDDHKTALGRKPKTDVVTHTSATQAYSSVGGLDKQIAQIRDLIEIPLTRPELFHYFGLKPPRGILLRGPPGTGKTHLARAIASSTNSAVLVINGPELSSAYHGETEAKIRDVFKDAHAKSPCIVVLDEVDALVPQREYGGGGEVEKRVVATLLTILDGMEDDAALGRVVVIGTTNRPNAIDPALRRPGRFDREIEIGVPDAEARYAILKVLLAKTPHTVPEDDLRALASRVHGYVGADLNALVREAGTIAIKRWLATAPADPIASAKPTLNLADLEESLPNVRPSALRELFVETPQIRYSDVGGQAVVIQKLREAVEWPLLHPEAFRRLGIRPPKGVLLYGPPGCSKTVLARACACESGVNFLAVKGPELLNKFVGESERAVREIFCKARAASPSIIFFDEIDALATSRHSRDGGNSPQEGVLTSLLNEMDGVQELNAVTVIAATNRPEALDSALMRPGRLDRILFVEPPDLQGREEIFTIHTKKMSVAPDVDIKELALLTSGCSGAEITSLCQEAALLTMQKDINAPYIPQKAFVAAAKAVKKQITPDVMQKYEKWRANSGIGHR